MKLVGVCLFLECYIGHLLKLKPLQGRRRVNLKRSSPAEHPSENLSMDSSKEAERSGVECDFLTTPEQYLVAHLEHTVFIEGGAGKRVVERAELGNLRDHRTPGETT